MLIPRVHRRQYLFTLALLALAFMGKAIVSFCQDDDAEVLRHFEAAHRAQNAGRYDVATREYSTVIRLRPQIAEAYASLGLVLNATGNFAESARVLEKADRLKPGLPGVSLNLGIDYLKDKHPQQAVARLEDAIRIEPKNREPRLWLCAAFLNSGRIDDALKELHQASLLYPDDPEILLRQGDTYRKAANLQMQQVLTQSAGKPLLHQVYGDMYLDEQQWQKAEGHYHRALEENDHWPNAHYGLGQTYLQQHKLDAAQKEFSEELSINANSAASSSMLAKISLLRGNPHEATTYLAEAIAKSPAEAASALGLPPSSTSLISQDTSRADEDDKEKTQQNLSQSRSMIEASAPSAARSLALAFLDGLFGDKEGASKAWEEFQNLAPQPDQSNPYERARVAFDRKDFEAAEKDLTTLLQVNPSEVNARYLLARTYRNQSLSVMGKLLAVAPDSYPAHQLMGETYESADEDEKALAEYRQVEKLAPDLSGIHFSIGSLLLKMNHADEAFTELQAELRQDPDHAETNAEIGSILLNRNQPDNALAYLQKAVQADPDSSPAHRELGRAYYMKEQYGQAEMELRQSLNDDPEGASHYQLAMVYRALGRTDAAKQMLALVRQIKFERYNEDERSTAAVQGIQ